MIEIPKDSATRQAKAKPVVLLVEDEPLVAMFAEEGLRSAGYGVMVAGSAAGAVRALNDGLQPTFAVIDVGLPDGRGDDLVYRLRDLRPGLRVVMVSGYEESELRARFAGETGLAIVSKPYTDDDLAIAARSLGCAPPSAADQA